MPILGLKANIDGNKIARIVTNLKKANSKEILSNVDFSSYTRRALEELERHFPKSSSGIRSPGSIRETQQLTGLRHLVDGFRRRTSFVRRFTGIDIQHKDIRKSRVREILSSLDVGSKAYTYVPPKNISFRVEEAYQSFVGSPTQFTTLKADKPIDFPARTGFQYSRKTINFINNVLVPELKADISKEAQKLVEK